MAESLLYHQGSRHLQDAFGSRAVADREEEHIARIAFTEADKAFIESMRFFFLATADAEGRPDCSFKGGLPGLVRVTAPDELAFPDFDGNGMFKSLGNIAVNPHVGLLFLSFDKPRRLRVNGTAAIRRDDPLLAHTVGAQLIVRVKARVVFPNCPRYVPTMTLVEESVYAPRAGAEPVEPAWKSFPEFRDVVPPRTPAARGDKEAAAGPHLWRGPRRCSSQPYCCGWAGSCICCGSASSM
jgi:uncharacterized protein